ncbi:phage tail tape measure protein [Streptomyces reticuli]|uniref:phage tail tape measure protein n=1 Tax=Streptomyces reticuli TaxID=1926 RepID=UPI00073DF0D9|nr:Phage-related minor tail protein [Streptomyces reticuli]
MPNVGYATLQVIPSVRGISDELRRQLTAPARDAGDEAGQTSGSRFAERWKAGLAAAGATAGALLVAATVSAVEKERMADRLSAQLGLTGKAAEKAGKVAGNLYSKAIVDEFEDGAAAVRAVMGSGLIDEKASTKAIEAVTTKVSDLATTFDQDLTMTANAAAQMIRTGLAKDGAQALDQLTRGLQGPANKADDLLETVNEYATQWRKMGLDGATALGLLNQAIAGGARDSDVAADAIKEFAIRAVDGSDSTKAGFKALGLEATTMAAKFGKGGEVARGALDLTLDRLRAIEDPVKREAAAVALFGTQAEDLAGALFSMDVTTAADSLGKVGGSAKTVGDTIRGNTSTELKILQRQLMGVFGTVVQTVVLPALGGLNDGVRWVGAAMGATGVWFREWGLWLAPIAALIVGITIALNAQAIATGLVTAVFSVYRVAILIGTAVTSGFTAAQALLNSVMALNPIALVVIALVALGAALVVAWKKSDTFRQIVMAAWSGIQTAALYVWHSVLQPAITGLMAGLSALGAAFSWLWTAVIQPVFSFIDTAARILLTVITVIVFAPIYLAVKLLGAVFSWLWTSAISPVVGWIVAGLGLLWAGAKVIFGYFTVGLRTVGRWAVWLWTSAISPVVGWIVAGLGLLWAGAKLIFGYFTAGLRTLGGWAKWLWQNAVAPAIRGVASVISAVYRAGIKPTLDKLREAIGLVGKAFGAAKDAIKVAWDKVKGIAKAPVSFIVNTVYNRGIVGMWNKVASAFGAPKLSTYKFATGGPVFGAGTETSDDIPAWLSKNEHVWTAKEVRGAGGHGAVMALRKWAAAGGHGRLPGFADGGGLFGWIGKGASKVAGWGSAAWDKVKAGAAWLKDTLAASAKAGVNAVVRPLLAKIPGLGTGIGDMIAKIPEKAIDALFGYADEADKKGASSSFGGGKIPTGQHAAIIKAALSAAGVPPPGTLGQWLSGLNTLITRESGWNASAINRTDSNAKAGHPSQGLAQTIPSTFAAYVPASLRGRGILDPVANVAAAIRYIVARYGNITRVQQADASKAPKGYAGGGRPRPGEVFWVGERGPELMQLGASGATVWDSATSLRMAAGLGRLRGFAKGTSGARAAARKDIPGDLSSVSKVLTASASDIKKAFDELTRDLKAAGGASRALAGATSQASAKLQRLAKQRDAVQARLEAAKQTAADQKKTAADFMGLSNLSDATSAAQIITGLRDRQATAKSFQTTIAGLSKRGLSQDLIGQLVAMGPDSALAGVVAGASKAQIKQLNELAKSGAKLSTSYGNTMADSMFDAGKNASKGFLTGLKSQEKELQAQMNKLGKSLVDSIKKKLKIKSPSRVTTWVGEMTGAGVGVGLDNTASTVAAAAARVADAAVPDVPAVSPASYTTTAAAQGGALAPGRRLYLVLEDGRQLAAYVDERADGRVAAGMRQVRRKVRAGSK